MHDGAKVVTGSADGTVKVRPNAVWTYCMRRLGHAHFVPRVVLVSARFSDIFSGFPLIVGTVWRRGGMGGGGIGLSVSVTASGEGRQSVCAGTFCRFLFLFSCLTVVHCRECALFSRAIVYTHQLCYCSGMCRGESC